MSTSASSIPTWEDRERWLARGESMFCRAAGAAAGSAAAVAGPGGSWGTEGGAGGIKGGSFRDSDAAVGLDAAALEAQRVSSASRSVTRVRMSSTIALGFGT